ISHENQVSENACRAEQRIAVLGHDLHASQSLQGSFHRSVESHECLWLACQHALAAAHAAGVLQIGSPEDAASSVTSPERRHEVTLPSCTPWCCSFLPRFTGFPSVSTVSART